MTKQDLAIELRKMCDANKDDEPTMIRLFEQFPWFKDKTINDITKVESFGEGHLYWENLDVDLSLEMIEHPERFPLQTHT